MTKCNAENFSGKTIHCGIDVHKESWTVTFLYDAPDQEKRHRIHDDPVQEKRHPIKADINVLLKLFHRDFPGGRLSCCYEAGFSGFELCRQLRERNADCIVVNPADVPTNGKERCLKCDALDSGKLARGLRSQMLRPVYVPTREEENFRSLVRCETQVRKDITAETNRLKCSFLFHGRPPLKGALGVKGLKALEDEAQARTPVDEETLSRIRLIRSLREERGRLRARILERLAALGLLEVYHALLTIPGVGYRVATVFISELMDIGRFEGDKRRLAAFVGIAPHARGSGSKERDCAVRGRKQGQLFYLLIQAAWMAAMRDGEFKEYFQRKYPRCGRTRAIVSVARKLLFTIYAVIRDRKPYEKGHVAAERDRRARKDVPTASVADAEAKRAVEVSVAAAIQADEELVELLPAGTDADALLALLDPPRVPDFLDDIGTAPEESVGL